MFDDNFFNDLMKDTNVAMAESSSLMNDVNRPKIAHPLWVINCICGGGIPMTLQAEFSGPPSSGKSTGSYAMLANYLRDNPDGIGVIIDNEGSVDVPRLQFLGVDLSRVLRLPASSIEEGFGTMFAMFKKLTEARKSNSNISVMVVYDSISSGGTNKQHEAANNGNSVLNAGAMMELPRILKQNTGNVFPFIENLPILVVYINQVSTTGIGSYVTKTESTGGFGFKHNMQFALVYGAPKDVWDGGFIVGSEGEVMMKKSKISPKFTNIPYYIDVTNGGKIDEVVSFVKYLTYDHIGIIKTGAYYNFKETIDYMADKYSFNKETHPLMEYYKSIRKNDVYKAVKSDNDLALLFQIRLIDLINEIYPLQGSINGEYKKSLIKKCSYFNHIDIETGEILE